MDLKAGVSNNERMLAALAHGSILLGVFTSGIGGIAAALVIWLTQREKSPYVAAQSLQALVYQTAVLLLSTLAFFCWGMMWVAFLLPAIWADPACCQSEPPPGLFAGLCLLICPLSLWFATIAYGIWGALRCIGGHDFKYVFIGNWLE